MGGSGSIIATQITETNFGAPEGNEYIAANGIIAPQGTYGYDMPGAYGTIEPITFSADVGAVVATVVARIEVRGKRRVLSIASGNVAVTGTSSFDIYNETQALALCAAQTVLTGGVTATTTITNAVVNDGDVLVLRGTSGTSITTLRVVLETQLIAPSPGLES